MYVVVQPESDRHVHPSTYGGMLDWRGGCKLERPRGTWMSGRGNGDGGGMEGDGDGVSPHPRLVGGRPAGLDGQLALEWHGAGAEPFRLSFLPESHFCARHLAQWGVHGSPSSAAAPQSCPPPPKPIPPAPNSSSNPNFSLPVLFSCWPAPFAYLRCIPPPPAVLSRTCLRRHCQYQVRGSLVDTRHSHEGTKKQLQPNPHVPAAFALKKPKPITQRATSANDGTQLP